MAWGLPLAEHRGHTGVSAVEHLAPLRPRLALEDLGNLCLKLIKVIELGQVGVAQSQLIKEDLVELRLNAANRHVEAVRGLVGLIEMDPRVEHIVTPGSRTKGSKSQPGLSLDMQTLVPARQASIEPGADVYGPLHHAAVHHLQVHLHRLLNWPLPDIPRSSRAAMMPIVQTKLPPAKSARRFTEVCGGCHKT